MADNQLLIEIVLDDGSVQKGFAKIKQSGEQAAKSLGDSFNKKDTFGGAKVDELKKGLNQAQTEASNFTKEIDILNLAFIKVGAIAATVGLTFKKALDFALVGEQVQAINKQFEVLATNAGLSAEALSNQLVAVSQGLIDDEDLLKIANQAIVNIGSNASKLPEILESARGASRALGIDFKNTFDNFSFFIETGNAKALKQLGIVLDISTAYKDYANQIGVSTDLLTEEQKQVIRINTLLKSTQASFAGVTESVTPLSDALTKLKVSVDNTGEAAAVAFSKRFAPEITNIANSLNQLVNGDLQTALKLLASFSVGGIGGFVSAASSTEKFSGSLQNINSDFRESRQELGSLIQKLEQYKELNLDKKLPFTFKRLKEEIQGAREELNKGLVEAAAASDNQLFAQLEASRKKLAAVPPANKEQLAKQAEVSAKFLEEQSRLELAYTNFLTQQQNERLALEQQNLNSIQDLDLRATELKRISREQETLLEQDLKNKLNQIDLDYSNKKGFNDLDRLEASIALEDTYSQKLIALKNKEAQDLKKIDDEKNAKARASAVQIAQILQSSVISTINSVGENLTKGGDFFKNFGDSVVGIFGDLLINVGNALIKQGLAIEAFIEAINTLTIGSGFAAAAAGVGLVLFGNALKASVSGKGGTSSPTPQTGGGGLTFDNTSPISTEPVNQQEQRVANQSVTVQIMGDVLDSDETGLRILKILNKEFDRSGATLRTGLA